MWYNIDMKRYFSPNEIHNIIDLYQSGASATDIGKVYGYFVGGITRILKENNIRIRDSRNFTDEQEAVIGDQYNSGISARSLAKIYGVDKICIISALRRQKIEQRNPSDRNRIYTINPFAFDNINQESAYWWGFLYADGCIRKRSLSVSLKREDKDHLEKLGRFLQSNTPVKDKSIKCNGNQYPISLFYITHEYLANRLRALGIIPNRPQFTLSIKNLPINNYSNWIRGLFDGDGSVSCSKQGHWNINICCQKEVAEWIAEVINGAIDIHPAKVYKHSKGTNIYYIKSSGRNNVAAIVDYLYKDADTFLERKRLKAFQSLIAPPPIERDTNTGQWLPRK